MANTELLDIKERLKKLSDSERRELSDYLIRLEQHSENWDENMTRRLDEMIEGKKFSLEDFSA